MANALKEGLVGYYPLQSNAVNMVDGVAGTINGTPSWRKNNTGKVVLDDTTASVSHASLPINTVTYWKDGKFYAVLNNVPYMIDEELNGSFTSCVYATRIGCALPLFEYIFDNANLYTSGSDTLLRNTGLGGVNYDIKAFNTVSAGSIIAEDITYGSTTVRGWRANNSNRYWQTLTALSHLATSAFVFECLFKRGKNGVYPSIIEPIIAQRASGLDNTYWQALSAVVATSGGPQLVMVDVDRSGIYKEAATSAPALETAAYGAFGMGTDLKPFVSINGVSAISSTALAGYLAGTDKITLGGWTDMNQKAAGCFGANRGWNGLNKTSAQLATLAEARHAVVAAGTLTPAWPELYQ